MFGLHNIPVFIEAEGVLIEIKKDGKQIFYRRTCNGENVEKKLLAKSPSILINPVEPINKPKEITQYLLIHFDDTVVIEPQETHKIYLTFPVAIAVFLKRQKEFDTLDIFTLTTQKYTLYGGVDHGVICRYWKSTISAEIPSVHYLYEGIMELSIKNASEKWQSVTKAVFNAYGMKIYYSNEMVSMKAVMTIFSEHNARTAFLSSPQHKGMQKSLELYTVRKLSVISSTFDMVNGL